MSRLPDPGLEYVFSGAVEVGVPRDLGNTYIGHRRIIDILGGTIEGPKLRGRILPGGADWQYIRADGVSFLEARYTIETHDGALIYVQNSGYRHGPKEIVEKLLRGEEVDPSQYYFRTVPWFETSDPRYAWMTKTVCLCAGERKANRVLLTVWSVS